jgi:hypothetical protein
MYRREDDMYKSNCPLHDVIEGLMTEVKEVEGIRTQFLDDLRN